MKFLDELAARRRFGMKPGLETIRDLTAALGHPEARVRAIHVAGTNGKGAVCAMLDACLPGRVGRYTSPHLVRLNERFFLDRQPVEDAALERIAARVFGVAAVRFPDLTFFEALTAVAFALYDEARPDWTILECGLGGRLDATNVCHPALSIITRIGLDHCDWLGETVEKIAAEKAGIVKPGVPVLLGANEPSVRAVVEARARAVGAPFAFAPDLVSEKEIPSDFSLAGSFNRENALTALAALKILKVGDPTGLSRVCWPGRFQRVGSFLIDGAHNPPAARALAEAVASEFPHGEKLNLIAGFCGDKDVVEVLKLLAPFIAEARAVRTVNPRSLSAEEAASKMRAVGLSAAAATSLRAAIADFAASPRPTLVCGSLFLAGEALVELSAYPWPIRFDPAEALVIPKH